MMENQAKEKLIEMKAEPEQGEKIYRKRSLVHLGVGNPRLGIEMACLSEPAINIKALEDSSLVRLGIGPPSVDEDTCLCLGVAQFT